MKISLLSSNLFPKMLGRDPQEKHRVVTNTELLIDLIYVVAIGVCSENFFELVAERNFLKANIGFVVVMFAICWPWINFLWFFSSFDTDDWFTRLGAMIQVSGIIILTTGISDVFQGLQTWHFNNSQLVIGYVTMRVGLVLMWFKVAVDSEKYRTIALRNGILFSLVQLGWILGLIFAPYNFLLASLLLLVEVLVPPICNYHQPVLPSHNHHIAERLSLLTIISLGEVIVGAEESFGDIYKEIGWNFKSILVIVFGVTLVFSIWRVYFMVNFVKFLERDTSLSRMIISYSHLLIFSTIAILSTGLKLVIDLFINKSELSNMEVLLLLFVPLLAFLLISYYFIFNTDEGKSLQRKRVIFLLYIMVGIICLLGVWSGLNIVLIIVILSLFAMAIVFIPTID